MIREPRADTTNHVEKTRVGGTLDIESKKREGAEEIKVLEAVLEKEGNEVVDYGLGKDVVAGLGLAVGKVDGAGQGRVVALQGVVGCRPGTTRRTANELMEDVNLLIILFFAVSPEFKTNIESGTTVSDNGRRGVDVVDVTVVISVGGVEAKVVDGTERGGAGAAVVCAAAVAVEVAVVTVDGVTVVAAAIAIVVIEIDTHVLFLVGIESRIAFGLCNRPSFALWHQKCAVNPFLLAP